MSNMFITLLPVIALGFNVTTSSEYGTGDHSSRGLLLNQVLESGHSSSWCAKHNNTNQWIKISFGLQDCLVRKIAIQGRADCEQWVKKFGVEYTSDGVNWQKIHDGSNPNVYKIFEGNVDQNTVVEHLISPVMAKSIKIIPLEWTGHISMRCEVYVEKL